MQVVPQNGITDSGEKKEMKTLFFTFLIWLTVYEMAGLFGWHNYHFPRRLAF